MRSPVILMVACALVLVGAYFASRLLVSDVPTPAATGTAPVVAAVVSAPPDFVQPLAAAPSRPALNRQEAEAAMAAPRQGLMQPVNKPMAHLVEGPPPAAEVASSPFQGESKELDYAESLLTEPNPSMDRLKSAHEVLTRCVEQEPDNARCRAALTTAQNRLGGKAATERVPERPTLHIDPPNVRPPLPK